MTTHCTEEATDDPDGAASPARRALWLAALGVVVAAAAVRALHLAADSGSPFFAVRGLDADRYHEYGLGWLAGTWPAAGKPFFWPPLYGFFLGFCYRVVGTDALAVKAVQCGLGALTCGLVYALAWRLFRDRTVALLAGLICAFHGVLVYYDAQLLSASLDVFLTVSVALALTVAWQTGRLWAWLAAGLLLGLSAINRGGAHLTAAAVCVWLLAAWRYGGRRTEVAFSPTPLVSLGVFALAFLAPVVPVALHNAHTDAAGGSGHSLWASPFLAANGGLNLYLGNDPAARELNRVTHPRHFAFYWRTRNEPRREGLRTMAEVNRYWLKRTWRAVSAAPGAWGRLMAEKVYALVQGAETPRNSLLYGHRRYSPMLAGLLWKRWIAFPNGLLIPLGLTGLALTASPLRAHLPLFLLLATSAAVVLAVFVADRYRLPLVACLSPYAARAAVSLGRSLRTRDWCRLRVAAPLLTALALVCNLRVGAMEASPGAFEFANLAASLETRGALRDAEAAYRQALTLSADHPAALSGLGYLLQKSGRMREARILLERAAATEAAPATLSDLANFYAETGETVLAETYYRKATAADPSDPLPWSNWGVLYAQTGKTAEALPLFGRAVACAEPVASSRYRVQLGSALATLGRFDDAAAAFREALKAQPRNETARALLRQIEGASRASGSTLPPSSTHLTNPHLSEGTQP